MLGPDPNSYPKGKKDPDYIAAIADKAAHPEKWGVPEADRKLLDGTSKREIISRLGALETQNSKGN